MPQLQGHGQWITLEKIDTSWPNALSKTDILAKQSISTGTEMINNNNNQAFYFQVS
jgi:hypothetical protein